MLRGVISVFRSVCRSVHNTLNALLSLPGSTPVQVCQVSAQQPVQTELLMRYHQLQSRLATLKIENEEVRSALSHIRRRRSIAGPFARCAGGFLLCSGVESFQPQCWALPLTAASTRAQEPSAWELPVCPLFWIEMGRFPSLLQNRAVF